MHREKLEFFQTFYKTKFPQVFGIGYICHATIIYGVSKLEVLTFLFTM